MGRGKLYEGHSADAFFELLVFFMDFVARSFSHVCEEKCPEKFSRKIPGKILQNAYSENPRRISAEGPGKEMRFANLLFQRLEKSEKSARP